MTRHTRPRNGWGATDPPRFWWVWMALFVTLNVGVVVAIVYQMMK